jgi:hypothetical protein
VVRSNGVRGIYGVVDKDNCAIQDASTLAAWGLYKLWKERNASQP